MVEYIEIDGLGRVEVSAKPPDSIPNKVLIGKKWVKIDKNLYKYLWALANATDSGRKQLSAIV